MASPSVKSRSIVSEVTTISSSVDVTEAGLELRQVPSAFHAEGVNELTANASAILTDAGRETRN